MDTGLVAAGNRAMMDNRFIAQLLPTDDLAVIGVSGGPDSLCLLDLARRIPKLNLIVAHFDHQLRPEANLEESLCAKLQNR